MGAEGSFLKIYLRLVQAILVSVLPNSFDTKEKEHESAGGHFGSFICFRNSIFKLKSAGMAAYLPWDLSFLIIPNGLIL
jgi:hypothetical protein